jgi:hypothetical protein
MRMIAVMVTALLSLAGPVILSAADQSGRLAGHKPGRGIQQRDVIHDEVVDEVRTTVKLTGMKEYMKSLDMKIPKGMKETHHISVEFRDAKTGKVLPSGEVKVKVINPDKSDQIKDLKAVQGRFEGDFELSQKGKYAFMCRFLLNEGKVRSVRFSYSVK